MTQSKGQSHRNGPLRCFLSLPILICVGFVPIWEKRRVDSRNRVKIPKQILQTLGVSNGSGYILFESIERVKDKSNEFLIRVGVGVKR